MHQFRFWIGDFPFPLFKAKPGSRRLPFVHSPLPTSPRLVEPSLAPNPIKHTSYPSEDYKYLPLLPPPNLFFPHSHHHHYFLPLPGTISHTPDRGLQISSSAFNPLSPILPPTTPIHFAVWYYIIYPSPNWTIAKSTWTTSHFQDADLTPIPDLLATNQTSSQGRASESVHTVGTSLLVSIKRAPILQTSAAPALRQHHFAKFEILAGLSLTILNIFMQSASS